MSGEFSPRQAEWATEYRTERQRWRPKPAMEPVTAKMNGHAQPLPTVVAATRLGKATTREFLDPRSELLPARNVILLGGDGGTGKSLLALQLALACTTGTDWLGLEVMQGPVVYFSAEDDQDEIDRRLDAICAAEDIHLDVAFELHILPLAGEDAALVTESHRAMRLQKTPLFRDLAATVEALTPMLLILDNLADVYSGNENNRSLVKAFVSMLRGLCLMYDCTVLMLGHPSLSGIQSGSGMSGSTAWSNSVRSRIYLKRPDGADLAADDDNARILEVMKANYGPVGQRLELKWKNGRFVRETPQNAWDRVTTADLERLQERFRAGFWRVNEQAAEWGGYAVAEILDMDVGRGIAAKERSKEQNRSRQNVRTYLAAWLRNGAVHVVNSFDAYRRPVQFFSDRPQARKNGEML